MSYPDSSSFWFHYLVWSALASPGKLKTTMRFVNLFLIKGCSLGVAIPTGQERDTGNRNACGAGWPNIRI